MTTEATGTRSRRSVIAAGLAGIGALAATALGRPVAASTAGPGDPILAGKGAIVGENTADVPTIVNTTTSNGDVLRAMAPGTGVALRGTSGFGTGVIGTAGDTSGMATALTENGVYGYSSISDNSVGVWGDGPYGLYGTGDVGRLADGGIGVLAFGSVGVWADVGPGNTGVYGFVGSGAAPAPAANVAVQATAQTTSQVALKVSGRVQFSRSGRTSIGATATSKGGQPGRRDEHEPRDRRAPVEPIGRLRPGDPPGGRQVHHLSQLGTRRDGLRRLVRPRLGSAAMDTQRLAAIAAAAKDMARARRRHPSIDDPDAVASVAARAGTLARRSPRLRGAADADRLAAAAALAQTNRWRRRDR